MKDDQITEALDEAPVPHEAEAQERGLRVVRAAFAQRPERPRSRWPIRRLGIVLIGTALLSGAILSPVGAEVRDWVRDAVDGEAVTPAPVLTALPGGGELLVDSEAGPWVVRADGSQRLLGDYEESTWSPRGLFIAVTEGSRLSAVDPMGTPRWTVSQAGPVSDPRWSPSGFRVAYRAGSSLRVVAGDGTGDELLASNIAPVAPAWRPGPDHVLAYIDANRRIRITDTDAERVLFSTGRISGSPTALQWSSDGRRLLAVGPQRLLIFDDRGRRVTQIARPIAARFVAASWEPAGRRIALLWSYGHLNPRTELVLARPGPHQRLLFAAPGSLTEPVWSPDGKRLLVSWQQADQWVFVPVDGSSGPQAIGDISAQFAPGAPSAARPAVAGWIQPRR